VLEEGVPVDPAFPADEVEGPFALRGPRVPALVVSPWVEQGQVSKIVFDHSSIIRTILQRFCATGGALPPLGPRVDQASHLGFVLKAAAPRFLTPLPPALRDDLLSRLGRRLIAADLHPPPARPPPELARQILHARQLLRAGQHPQRQAAHSGRPPGRCADP
jgi:phospholipase C